MSIDLKITGSYIISQEMIHANSRKCFFPLLTALLFRAAGKLWKLRKQVLLTQTCHTALKA